MSSRIPTLQALVNELADLFGPNWAAVMRDGKRRRFDVLLVWKIDRLGRSLRHLLFTLDELTQTGGFVSVTQSVDTTSPQGKLMLGLLRLFAKFERESSVSASSRPGTSHA